MNRSENCPSMLTLSSYFVNELQEIDLELVSNHIKNCKVCSNELEKMKNNSNSFETVKETELKKLQIKLKEYPENSFGTKFLAFFSLNNQFTLKAGLAVTAIAIIILIYPLIITDNNTYMYKGTMSVQIIAKRTETQFEVLNDQELKKGDMLRFMVTIGTKGYLAIFSLDKNLNVSHFYPDTDTKVNDSPLFINRSGKIELPESIILDENLGIEYLVVVFREKPFSREKLVNNILKTAKQYDIQLSNNQKLLENSVIRILKIKKIE